jgi:hypothetical protein
MARISYTSIIILYQEDRIRSGNRIDKAIIMLPDDPDFLEESIHFVFSGEDNGFLDKMFGSVSRLDRDAFCMRMLTECYYFLQPHKIRQLVYTHF